jgi:Uma2 family endonuclease
MAMPNLVERYWTAEDVRALPEDGNRYECIDGALLVTPAPRYAHQYVVGGLCVALHPFVEASGLGVCLMSPADIELFPGTTVQPDVYVADAKPGGKIRDWQDIATLRLAVEVLSSSTARRDRGIKREFYQRAGVNEYWIVDLDARLVERWTPSSERPEILRETLRWAPAGAAEPLEIDLPRFFAKVLGD